MKRICLALAAGLVASAAAAQDIYLGASLDYANPHSGSDHAAVGLLGGATFWDDGQLSFAAQGEYNTPMAGSGKPDAARLRALASYDLSGFTAVGGLGLTQYRTGEDTFGGLNMSLGVDYPVGSRATYVRGEIVRDWMDGYGSDVTTTRIGYIYNF